MPIDAGVIPISAILIMMLIAGKKKKPGTTEQICPPFEWLAEEVDQAITAGIEAGICAVGELTAATADLIYPETPDKKRIAWPKAPPWAAPAGAAEAVQCIWYELEWRVRERLDALPPGACGPAPTPSDVIKPFVAKPGKPRWGNFYQIVRDDDLTTLVKTALGITKGGNPLTAPGIRCVTNSEWNQVYYGTPWDPNNVRFPKYAAVETDDGLRVISKAFFPRHQNALHEMYAGRLPERTIDDTMAGASLNVPGANSYGLLWFPATRVVDGKLVCPDGSWPDGRPKSEPPPEVIALLS